MRIQDAGPVACATTASVGVYDGICSISQSIESIPMILNTALRSEPLLAAIVDSIVATAIDDLCATCTRDGACDLLTERWSVMTDTHRVQDSDLLRFRVSSFETILAALPLVVFTRNCAFSVQQQVIMWMTAHVPMHIWLAAHQAGGTAPDTRHPVMKLGIGVHTLPHMASIVTDLDFYNFAPLRRAGLPTDYMHHIMSKALPRRCQIRELYRFICDYTKKNNSIAVLFERLLIISILSLYPQRTRLEDRIAGTVCTRASSHTSLRFESVVSICAHFFQGAKTNKQSHIPGISAIFGTNQDGAQSLMFFMIQQLLVYQVQLIPAMRVNLSDGCRWNELSNSVDLTSRSLETIWKHSMPSNVAIVDAAVSSVSKSTKRLRFNADSPHRSPLCATVADILEVYKKQTTGCMKEDWAVVKSTLERVALPVEPSMGVFDRLCPVDVHSPRAIALVHTMLRACHTNGDSTYRLLADLKKESIVAYYHTMHVLHTMHADLSVSVHKLPDVIWEKQVLATDRKWASVGGLRVNPQANTMIVCTGCHMPKVDYQPVTESATYATSGCVFVTVDTDSHRMICSSYRAKSVATTDKITGTMAKNVATLHCGKFALSRVHLIGNIVTIGAASYSVCTECACIMEIDMDGSGGLCICSKCTHGARNSGCAGTHGAQIDGGKKSTQCGVCKSAATHKHTTMCCMYSSDAPTPLEWVRMCNRCNSSYTRLCTYIKTHRGEQGCEYTYPFTVATLRSYGQVQRCRSEYDYATNHKRRRR
jgi:hypothetical protein